jgi:hypothetical protein
MQNDKLQCNYDARYDSPKCIEFFIDPPGKWWGGEVTQILTLRHCIVVVLIQFLVSHLSSLGFWLFNSLLEASHSLYLFMYCYGYVTKVLY